MNPRFILFCAILTALFSSCKKDNVRCNWRIFDNLGNELGMISNKTESELLDCTTCGTFNGGQPGRPLREMLQPCNYLADCDPEYCWVVNNRYYESITDKYAGCFYVNITSKGKVACGSCGNWMTRLKMTYVPAGTTRYSNISQSKAFCNDTATAFNTGEPFVIKNTADSLVVLQYSKDGTNWH